MAMEPSDKARTRSAVFMCPSMILTQIVIIYAIFPGFCLKLSLWVVLGCDTSNLGHVLKFLLGLLGRSLRHKYLWGVSQRCCSCRFTRLISWEGVSRACSRLLFLNRFPWVSQVLLLVPLSLWSCLGSVGLGVVWSRSGLIYPLDIPSIFLLLLFYRACLWRLLTSLCTCLTGVLLWVFWYLGTIQGWPWFLLVVLLTTSFWSP